MPEIKTEAATKINSASVAVAESVEAIPEKALGADCKFGSVEMFKIGPDTLHVREVMMGGKTYTRGGLTALVDALKAELDRVTALLAKLDE